MECKNRMLIVRNVWQIFRPKEDIDGYQCLVHCQLVQKILFCVYIVANYDYKAKVESTKYLNE